MIKGTSDVITERYCRKLVQPNLMPWPLAHSELINNPHRGSLHFLNGGGWLVQSL